MCSDDQPPNRRQRQAPDRGDPPRLQLRVGGRDVGVDAGARGRDRVDRDVVDRQARVVRALELEDRRAPLPDRPWQGRGSSARGWRTSCRPRCRPAPSPMDARGSSVGLVKPCAARREPTTWPLTLTRLPFAWLEKATCAKPVKSAGSASPKTSVSTTTAITEDFEVAQHQCDQPFDERPEGQGGEDHQAGGQHDHADEQDDEGRPVGAERAGRDGRGLLAGERAAERERGEQRREAAEVAAQPSRVSAREARGAVAGEGAAVVVRLGGVGVQRLAEAVRARVEDRRESRLASPRRPPSSPAPSSGRRARRVRRT